MNKWKIIYGVITAKKGTKTSLIIAIIQPDTGAVLYQLQS